MEAQHVCCNFYGGRLWEPSSFGEMLRVSDLLMEQGMEDDWTWWIGANNFRPEEVLTASSRERLHGMCSRLLLLNH